MRKRGVDERGAVAVEFALISTILFVILFAIIEFGIALNQYQIFTQAAREGARKAAVRQTNDIVRAAVYNAVGSGATNCPAANGYCLSQTPTIKLNKVDVVMDPGPACKTDGSTVGQDVSVEWTQDLKIVIPFLPDLSQSEPIRAVFRCE
jgi:Flp pilus assembly protein TadG